MAKRLTPVICILMGLLLLWSATGSSSPQAYLFPKILAVTMTLLGVVMAIVDWRPRAMRADTLRAVPWNKLWPVLVIFVLYMVAAQPLGFYLTSWLAFSVIGIVYAPSESSLAVARRCVPVSLAFLAVLYAVFAVLLQVQMPKGVLL